MATRHAARPKRASLAPAATAALILAAVLAVPPKGALGQQTRAPSRGQTPQHIARPVELSPRVGPPGTRVTVTASSMPALTPIQLAMGGTRSGFEALAIGLTDEDGNLEATAEVPSWAQRDHAHRFIIFNLYFTATLAESGLFHVTDADGKVVREGEVGVSEPGRAGGSEAPCPILTGDDGETYRLTGATDALEPGQHVVIEGALTESTEGCGQGVSLTLEIISNRVP